MEENINPKKLPTLDWDWLEENGWWDRKEAAKWYVPLTVDVERTVNHIAKIDFIPLLPNAQLGRTKESLNGESLKNLRGFGKLKKLSFPNLLTDEGMKYIGQLGKLQTLYISQNHLTSKSAKYFANLTGLKDIEANNFPPGGEIIQVLATLPKLTHLRLTHNAGVVDDDLAPLKDKKLKLLWINGENVTGKCLKYVGQIETLKDLVFGSNQYVQNVTNDDLKLLSGLVNLQRLKISGTKVTLEGLVHLEPLKSLKKLIVDKGWPSTPEAKALKMAIPGLSIRDRL